MAALSLRLSNWIVNLALVTTDRDEDSGQFTEEYDKIDFLDAVETLETPTTNNVAEYVGCSYDLAYRRLKSLENEGVVRVNEVGSSFLWSRM